MAILDEHRSLREAIQDRKCVLFLGAGVSSYDPEGLSGGAQFAHDLALRGNVCKIKKCDNYIDNKCSLGNRCYYPLQRVAEYYEFQEERSSLNDYLKRRLTQTRQPLKSHRIIAELHRYFPKVITTNADELLEEAYRQQGVLTEVIVEDTKIHDSDAEVSIIKMHGCISKYSKEGNWMVITETDYYKRMTFLMGNSFMARELKRYLQEFRVIFIGYSLEDSTFGVLLQGIKDYLGDLQKLAYAIQHEVDPLEKSYWEKRKIKVLDVDLLEFLEELNERFNSDLGRAREELREGLKAWGETGVLLTSDNYELINGQKDAIEGDEARELMMRSAMDRVYSEFAYWANEIEDKTRLACIARDLLNNDNKHARYNSIKLLSEIGFAEGYWPKLFELLDDPYEHVQAAAAEAIIANLDPDMAGACLFELLKQRPSFAKRTSEFIVTTLCRLDPYVIVPLFRKKLDAEEGIVQKTILEHFRGSRAEYASQCVAEALTLGIVDPAMGVLATIGDDVAVDALKQVATDPHSPVRMRIRAVECLGEIKTTQAVKALEGMLEDENEQIIKEAIYALGNVVSAKSSQFSSGDYDRADKARCRAGEVIWDISRHLEIDRTGWLKSVLEDSGASESAKEMALEGLEDLCEDDALRPILERSLSDDYPEIQLRAAQMLVGSFGMEFLTASLLALVESWRFGVVLNVVSRMEMYRQVNAYRYTRRLYNRVWAIEHGEQKDSIPNELGLNELYKHLKERVLDFQEQQLRRSNDV